MFQMQRMTVNIPQCGILVKILLLTEISETFKQHISMLTRTHAPRAHARTRTHTQIPVITHTLLHTHVGTHRFCSSASTTICLFFWGGDEGSLSFAPFIMTFSRVVTFVTEAIMVCRNSVCDVVMVVVEETDGTTCKTK